MNLKNKIPLLYVAFMCILMVGCNTNCIVCEPPPEINDTVFVIDENTERGIFVGQVEADGIEGVELVYDIISSEYSRGFSIDEKSGIIRVNDPDIFDFEVNSTIEIQVLVSYEFYYQMASICNVEIVLNDISEEFLFYPNKDAFVRDVDDQMNFGLSTYLRATAWTRNLIPFKTRFYIDFALKNDIDIERLQKAELILFNPNDEDENNDHSMFSGTNDFYIGIVEKEWSESDINWSNQPNFNQTSLIKVAGPSNNDHQTIIDLTVLLKQTIEQSDQFYGLCVRLVEEDYYRRVVFASREHENQELKPYLQITYD